MTYQVGSHYYLTVCHKLDKKGTGRFSFVGKYLGQKVSPALGVLTNYFLPIEGCEAAGVYASTSYIEEVAELG